jgi:hypothetical protein
MGKEDSMIAEVEREAEKERARRYELAEEQITDQVQEEAEVLIAEETQRRIWIAQAQIDREVEQWVEDEVENRLSLVEV